MCLEQLNEWQNCLPETPQNASREVFIPSATDQEQRETQATLLFTGLELVTPRPSQDCDKEFSSFWCLLLFGVCDGNGISRFPSFELCHSLQIDTCSEVIEFASNVPEFSMVMQNCKNFRLGNLPPCGEYIEHTAVHIACLLRICKIHLFNIYNMQGTTLPHRRKLNSTFHAVMVSTMMRGYCCAGQW